ncbi:MAG: hypothetical protein QXK18_03035, partial [Candidatus Bathyarchaeia archaeon]
FIENMTETLDYVLVQTLNSLVEADGFYKVKVIKEAMASNFDEPQKWLTTKWIGNALRRLGFTEKRRFGSGYEYFLSKSKVKDLAERLGVSESASPSKFTYSLSSLNASIPEVYKALREKLNKPFYTHEAVKLIKEVRQCTPEEAEKLFQIWQNEGKVFLNAHGLWEWIG